MDSSLKPKHAPDFRLEVMDDEMLIYHPSQTKVVYCNATAALVWRLCNAELTVGEIIDLLTNAYPEARDAVPAQVRDILTRFMAEGVIAPA